MGKDKIWADAAAVNDFLLNSEIGHLTTIDPDGWPHTIPLNYVWHGGAVFFHTGSGGKMARLARHPQVAFAVTEALNLLTSEITADINPCRDTNLGRSVLILGLAEEIKEPARKIELLNLIIAKYDPQAARLGDGPAGSMDAAAQPGFAGCRVVKIEVSRLTARRLLLLNKPAEYRAAVADHFQKRGLHQGSARDLKTALLLRQTLGREGR
jgi:nitroimidazol reductase NimA-like FMN-containing flavoprotein (pyridoxamine 5'-phosphate oxidase superfamily)